MSAIAKRAKSSWGYAPEWLAIWSGALSIDPDYLRNHRSWVAAFGNEVVGFCVLEAHDRWAALEHVWVTPEVQRRGVGRALVQTALTAAKHDGVVEVHVEADPLAEPFYLRLGARRVGDRPAPMPGAPDRSLPLLKITLGND